MDPISGSKEVLFDKLVEPASGVFSVCHGTRHDLREKGLLGKSWR